MSMEDYFNFLDEASIGKSYDWSSLHINLNFEKSDVDIDAILSGSKTFGDSLNEALFIHEYVHYLQNFHCNWGALVFCEYVLAFEKIGVSKVEEVFKRSLPLKVEPVEGAKLWNDGIQHFKNFERFLGTDIGNITTEKLNPYPNYVVKEISDDKLVINNGLISYTVNSKTVREHMAELSSMLFINYSDHQTHDRFVSSPALCSLAGNLDKQPMYWMVFEYFFYHEYENIAEGLVLLNHGALCTATPVKTIIRFFKFITEFKENIGANKNLLQIVQFFLETPVEVVAFSFSFNKALEAVVNQLQLCTKHNEHDFFKFNSTLFSALMLNIKNFYSAKLIFQYPTDLRQKEFWVNLLRNIGTPIIRYKDRTPVITTSNFPLIESLTYFLGVSKTFENLQTTSNYKCPFHTDFNICKATYRDDDKCLHDPLTVKNPAADGEECHYQNAITLLGLVDRIN